ncbi:ATP-binding protein, partial [Streptomyces sp. Act-28]
MNPSTSQPSPTAPAFSQLFSSTRRGARLARLLTTTELRARGCPPGMSERAEAIVAELAANAVLHGHVRGRGFRLGLGFAPESGTLRIEVTDARGERTPAYTADAADADGEEGTCGQGVLVDRSTGAGVS